GPGVEDLVAALGSSVVEQRYAADDRQRIAAGIAYLAEMGVDLILLEGGLPADAEDRTSGASKADDAAIVGCGTPMLPVSMRMMAYLDAAAGDGGGQSRRIPAMGLPGCVMHDPYTSFDVLLPRICAGETIGSADITAMGYGGLYTC